MRWEKCRIAIRTICAKIVSLYNASAEVDDLSDVENLISSFEDQRIDSGICPFSWPPHGYAFPNNDYVKSRLYNIIYKLAPMAKCLGCTRSSSESL
jgi:hypothetical protein